MSTIHCASLAEFGEWFEADMKALESRAYAAIRETAREGVEIARENVPVAFGELTDSIHDAPLGDHGAQVLADAPHAEGVEIGTRPHYPPLEPLIAWVKLRGMQGITPGTYRGTTTQSHAKSVAGRLRAMESGGSLDTDAPERIARAIQQAIGKRGTAPHWFMATTFDDVLVRLDINIKAALPY